MNNTNRLIVAYQVQKKLTEFPQFTLCINPAVAHDHATDIYMWIHLLLTLASEAWAEGYSSHSVCLSVCVSVCLRYYSKTAGSYDFLLSEIAFLHTRKNLGYVL